MTTAGAKRAAVTRTKRGARYGSGSLLQSPGARGDTWVAKWRDGGRQVHRSLGLVHSKRQPDGLTRAEAEAAFGRLREQVAIERADERAAEAKRVAEDQRRPLARVGESLIAAKRAAGRKPSTIEAYSYWLRIHIIATSGRCRSARSPATTCAASRPRSSARGSLRSHAPTRSGRCTR